MNRIRLLSEQVANQIAAGEVVERPASVVKELVENALDARARQVKVEIQAGGRALVRVTDDGLGMSRDDALLCLERHATSKIVRAEDLAAIATMGFRGEALPSIASVSRFTLTTREREGDSPEGTQIVVNGGKIVEVRTAGSAPGTSVEVRQIFFNLPARRKFLRSEETEAAHIQHYLGLAALAYPEVAFTFHKDGRQVWQLPAVRLGDDPGARLAALRERLRALWGDAPSLLAVDFSAKLPAPAGGEVETGGFSALDEQASPFRVWGFLGAPGVSRATREDQCLFVNRRPVENRSLNHALLEGYHTALMKGRYPVCCLFLEIHPASVDVNIHPTKREVKFHREFDVRRFVTQAVRQTLLAFHAGGESRAQAPTSEAERRVKPQTGALPLETVPPSSQTAKTPEQANLPVFPSAQPLPPVARSAIGVSPAAAPELRHVGQSSPTVLPPSPPVAPPPAENAVPIPEPRQVSLAVPKAGPPSAIPVSSPANPQAAIVNPPSPVPLLNVPLRLVGVVGDLYVVLESDRGLVLLDQHAAHERVLFEQMLNRLEQAGQAPSQRLLLPETIEVGARDAQFLRDQLPALTRLGVSLSEFGERTFLLDALPPFVKAGDPRRFVLDLVDELKAVGKEVNSLRLGEHTVAKTVCRHAVKAHDPLVGAELENLIAALRHCAMPYTCPHGRPTLLEMNYRELEKKFGRQA